MNRERLVSALRAVLPAIAVSSPREELRCFDVHNSYVQAVDGRMFVRVDFAENVDLSFTVPAEAFYKVLSSLSEDEVSLKLSDSHLSIYTKRLRGRVALVDQQLFPKTDFPDAPWIVLPKDFSEGVSLCRVGISSDLSAPIRCGVCISGDKLYSTDRYRISRFVMSSSVVDKFVIPACLVDQITSYKGQEFLYSINGGKVFFSTKLSDLIVYMGASLLEGEYPEVETFVTGKEMGSDYFEVKLPLAEVKQAVERHLVIQEGQESSEYETKVSVTENGLTLRSAFSRVGELEETIPVAFDRRVNDAEFLINTKFLKEILASSSVMKYSLSGPFVIFEAGQFLHFVMTREKEETQEKGERT